MLIPQIPGLLADVVPLWIQTNPLFPQLAPHEFLTIQYAVVPWALYPTAKTPWSSDVPHDVEVMTPDVYNWKTG